MSEHIEITRAFVPAELEVAGDGRTIVGRCVPYNVPTMVADLPPADPTPYLESWARGAFRSATKDPSRVGLTFMHLPGLREVVGRGVQFTESDGGLDGVFRAVEHDDGDKALALVRDGSFRGLSIHAAVMRSRRRPDGAVERQVARLIHVALVDQPAYEDAQVTAVRAAAAPAPALELAEVRAQQERYRLRFASSAHS